VTTPFATVLLSLEWKKFLLSLEFFDVDGRVIFILLFTSGFSVMPCLMLEYTGEIFGEYLDDLGVRSFRPTVGSSSLGLMPLNLLLDICFYNITKDDIF